ncbi:LysR family transcriptional regulator [Bradyrhizobium sp. LHD-71]|uniref:LysR family transcriptional regulator n=1 Tax=Bradyrhizobium sp. LHD-71 TaxID=3072141 RepID=UPI00280F4A56|nr:LysR family transcriptional regulator [Bradyrhizobium sp. LHD-71]MDQ8732185.1 LysR family transcriptional regulator [Bradyrhizobium sp. LHD-71]
MPPTDQHLLARLRFRHLQLIAEIERTGSLSKSAESLNLTQPALSKALKEIEAMLGFPLFNRGARGLQKTLQGEIVMHGAILLLRELQHLHAEAQFAGPDGRVAGILRLGAPAFLSVSLLPRVVARLAAASPPLAVSLSENNVPGLIQELLDGTLDALVTVYNPEAMAITAGRGVRFERITDEEYVVIATAAHPLARSRNVSWQTLTAEQWVLTRRPSLARNFVEDSFRRHGLEPPLPLCETDSPVTSARMVAEGVGVSSVPVSTAREAERNNRVRRIRLQAPQPSAMLGLVYRSVAVNHPRIGCLRDAMRQVSGTQRR